MPLDSATVSCLGVPLNTSDFAVYSCGCLDEVSFIVIDAFRGAIVKHERLGVRVELSSWRVFGDVVCPGRSHDGNVVTNGVGKTVGLSCACIFVVSRCEDLVDGTCGALSFL